MHRFPPAAPPDPSRGLQALHTPRVWEWPCSSSPPPRPRTNFHGLNQLRRLHPLLFSLPSSDPMKSAPGRMGGSNKVGMRALQQSLGGGHRALCQQGEWDSTGTEQDSTGTARGQRDGRVMGFGSKQGPLGRQQGAAPGPMPAPPHRPHRAALCTVWSTAWRWGCWVCPMETQGCVTLHGVVTAPGDNRHCFGILTEQYVTLKSQRSEKNIRSAVGPSKGMRIHSAVNRHRPARWELSKQNH